MLPPELPRLDGLLALDAFRGQVLTVDWPRQQLTVHAAGTSTSAVAASGLRLRAATGESGRMFTVLAEVRGPRGALWFLIDSGNLRGTLIDLHVLRDSLLVLQLDSSVALEILPRASSPVRASFGDFIVDGVLGTDFLQRGPVALDLRRFTP